MQSKQKPKQTKTKPDGPAPSDLSLSERLAEAGRREMLVDSKSIDLRQLLVCMLWNAATNGEIPMNGGAALTISTREWFEIVRFIFAQIEGPAHDTTDEMDEPTEAELEKASQILFQWRAEQNDKRREMMRGKDFERPTSNEEVEVERRTSNIEHPTSNEGNQD